MDLFDLLGPVMIGPSSSHTAGAARIGLTAHLLLGEDVAQAQIGLHGSFACTGSGHGTDRALVGGLLGMNVDDERIRSAIAIAKNKGVKLSFQTINLRDAHPNTVQLHLTGISGRQISMEAASIGGGLISIRKLDGMRVEFSGRENTLIIHHIDEPGLIASVTSLLAQKHINIGTMQVYRQKIGSVAMMVLELDSVLTPEVLHSLQTLPRIESATYLKGREAE